jgi:PadR family transcriptional regulator AphA
MKANISPEPALLGFLLDGRLHGYELYKRVRVELGPVWHLGLSQMYAILAEYEARGWIRTRVQAQGARPAKKMLEITAAGRRAFDAWMAQSARGLREFRVDFFARLYFAHAAGTRVRRQLLAQQLEASRRELEPLQRAAATDDDAFRASIREFRIEQLSAAIAWLERRQQEFAPRRPVAPAVRRRQHRPTKAK